MDTRKFSLLLVPSTRANARFPGTKVLNGVFIAGGILVALFTSWYVFSLFFWFHPITVDCFRTVYNSVQSHIRHIDGFPPEVDGLAAEAVEDYDEEAPLLSPAPVEHRQ